MGGQEDGALSVTQLGDQAMDLEAHLWIESSGGLVQENHLRVVDQSQRERHTLLLATGQSNVELVTLVPKLEALEQLVVIDVMRVKRREERQSLPHRDFVREVGRLQAYANAILDRADVYGGIVPEYPDFASGAFAQPFQDLHRGRLARAIRAEQAENLARSNIEVDPSNRFEVSI
jgi:hypothetical protein